MRTDFHFTCAPPAAQLRVEGELDLTTRERLWDVLRCLRHRGCTRLELDLAAVTFIDAGTLALLHAEQQRLVPAGGEVVVVAASDHHQLVARVAGYDALLAPETRPRAVGRGRELLRVGHEVAVESVEPGSERG